MRFSSKIQKRYVPFLKLGKRRAVERRQVTETLISAEVKRRVADGIRTRDLRNHNPGDSNSKVLLEQVVTAGSDSGCTAGCTSNTKSAHETPSQVNSEADAHRLALLAADGQLQAVVDSWGTLPDAVRVGIVAMVASCQPKG